MESDHALQLLLPTDKRNPSLSLYRDEAQQSIHVYYGFELLEKVPEDRKHPQYKLMVANLYNAGLKVASLEEIFGFDRKTMREWGQALQSGDGERLKQALEGREGRRKLTPAIVAFIEFRFEEVYAQHRGRYNLQLREEVQEVFKVKLSGETLRPLLQSLISKRKPQPEVAGWACPESLAGVGVPELPPIAEIPVSLPPAAPGELGCELAGGTGLGQPPARKPIPAFTPWVAGQTHWSDHLGVLLFWNALIQILAAAKEPEPLLRQWLAGVLLGCHNIEQTKYLNWEDLTVLLGQVTRFPAPQREELERLGNLATIQAVWRWNVGQVEGARGGDFYLDPHTKHYTGMMPILKGWCAAIRWADKALHSDFLHTVKGEAVYCQCADNFEDLRQRFWGMVSRARQVLDWPPEKVLTLVVDRGIFAMEVFEKILADPYLHLITWEKGYVAGQWCPKEQSGEFTLERKRNRADDVRVYRFQYIERKWAKNPRMRQFIVLATNPAGRQVEVSVLSDDPDRPAAKVILLIFNRWVQENDFKYLDKHFGINQITSYRTVEYAKLAGQIDDRQIRSGQAKALQQKGQHLRRQQARWLVEQEGADYQHQQRLPQIAALEGRLRDAASAEHPQLSKTLHQLRQASLRYEEKRTARRQQIDELNRQLQENERQKLTVQKEESRLEQLVAQGMHRLDTVKKELLDTIKVSARNLFYRTLQPFKKAYDNYRDDHDYFRKLTHSGGVLRWTGSEFQAHLVPQVNYPPALRRIIKAWLEEVNATQPMMPDGSQRPLRFSLSDRNDFEIRLK
jgi:hypothetical protein